MLTINASIPTNKQDMEVIKNKCLITGKALVKQGKVVAANIGTETKAVSFSILTTGLVSLSELLHKTSEKLLDKTAEISK